ncbi:hypothetical protein V499_04945 [Pseudogymnoascus sp. VKM F-103]|nr:hypothetical protein V499_04945 [Pseudogymnoascus sp. VKM F-103]
MDIESDQSLELGRQCRLTSDAAPSGLYMVGWGLQSDRLHNMHSPDRVPCFGSRWADCSPKLSAGTQTPLLRPVKLQQPNQQKASDYDVWLMESGSGMLRKVHFLAAEHGKG